MAHCNPVRNQLACAVFVSLVLAGAAGVAGSAKGPSRGDPANGRVVYMKTCVVCHFADGSGGKKVTPAGNPSRDFRDPKFWEGRTDDQIRKTVNEGVAKSGMIAWKGVLKPQEIEDVIAYVRTFPKAAAASGGKTQTEKK